MEIDLTLSAGLMGLRHDTPLPAVARLGQNLRTAFADMITHRRIDNPSRHALDHLAKTRRAVWRCFLGASTSLRNISSIAALYGSSRGATRWGVLRTGGIADANA